jgi:hypothetical protein
MSTSSYFPSLPISLPPRGASVTDAEIGLARRATMSTTSAAAEDWIHLELMVEHHHDSGDPNLRGEATRRCLEQTAGLAGDAQQCASLRQPAAPVETRRASTAKCMCSPL